ncbi:MAG TPA: hypothetical protein VD927_00465, partial [Chryseosolibacter sp.]|nr:hypothetical protein [Chryseosolibacter sp.]
MKKILLLGCLLLSFDFVISQPKSVPGYFVVNGDTTRSNLIIGNYDGLTLQVTALIANRRITLRPDSIEAFGFENKLFLALADEPDLTPFDKVFFQVIVSGRVSLLQVAEPDRIRKFIQSPTGEIAEMIETFRTENGRKLSNNEFRIALKNILIDAPSLYKLIDNSRLSVKDLKEIVMRYNGQKNETVQSFEYTAKINARLILYGGVSNSIGNERVVFRGGAGTEIRRTDLSRGTYFTGGIFFRQDPFGDEKSNDHEINVPIGLGLRIGRMPRNPNIYFGLMPTLVLGIDNYGERYKHVSVPLLFGINKRFTLTERLGLYADLAISSGVAS